MPKCLPFVFGEFILSNISISIAINWILEATGMIYQCSSLLVVIEEIREMCAYEASGVLMTIMFRHQE